MSQPATDDRTGDTGLARRLGGVLAGGPRAVVAHPLAVAVVAVEWVTVCLTTVLLLQNGLWARFERDLLEDTVGLSLEELTDVVAVTPADVIAIQFRLGLLAGALVAVPTAFVLASDGLDGRWRSLEGLASVLKAVLTGVAVGGLGVAAAAMAYQFVVPHVFGALLDTPTPRYSVVELVEVVAVIGFSAALLVSVPALAVALPREHERRGAVGVRDVLAPWLALALFGLVFWPLSAPVQSVWNGAVLVALALGVTAARGTSPSVRHRE